MLRVSQLLVLLVISRCAMGAEQDILIVGFGLLGSFAMLTDSGAANFILSGGPDSQNRESVRRAVWFHAATSGAGTVVATLLTGLSDGRTLVLVWPVFAALAATQLLDSVSRVVRAPHMAAQRDVRYAVPDLILVLVKISVIGFVWLTGSVWGLLALPIPSLVQVVVAWIDGRRFLAHDHARAPRLLIRVAEFGVTGALNAFYTQVPLLYAAVFWSPAVVAQVSVAYRVVQAFDLLPGTASLQLIPRARTKPKGLFRSWLVFAGAAAIVSAVLIVGTPLIDAVLGGELTNTVLFASVVIAFIPRSGNYALMAFAMGLGRIRARLIATSITCVVAVGLVAVVASAAGADYFGLSSFSIEVLFSALIITLLRRRSAPRAVPVARRVATPPVHSRAASPSPPAA